MNSKLATEALKVLDNYSIVGVDAVVNFSDEKGIKIGTFCLRSADGTVEPLALSWPCEIQLNGELFHRFYDRDEIEVNTKSTVEKTRQDLIDIPKPQKVIDLMIVATDMRIRGEPDMTIFKKMLDLNE